MVLTREAKSSHLCLVTRLPPTDCFICPGLAGLSCPVCLQRINAAAWCLSPQLKGVCFMIATESAIISKRAGEFPGTRTTKRSMGVLTVTISLTSDVQERYRLLANPTLQPAVFLRNIQYMHTHHDCTCMEVLDTALRYTSGVSAVHPRFLGSQSDIRSVKTILSVKHKDIRIQILPHTLRDLTDRRHNAQLVTQYGRLGE
ncbi:hypothetical protein BaRGS_00032041 [Batillaria attramentaria]|uniref:Uncharacterized protein n=1 Tax=Batillaria attramentaria TaxID=370345 RepID=A0ABD0JNQ5_9CAEN